MSVLSSVFHFFFHASAKVSQIFVKLFGKQASAELAHAALNVLEHSKLGSAIYEYVDEIEHNVPALEADIKKLQVFAKARAFAEKYGFTASDSVINLVIELAVQKLKGAFAKASHDAEGEEIAPNA